MMFLPVGLLVLFLSLSSEVPSLSGLTDGQEVNVLSRPKRGLYYGTPEYRFFDDFFTAWKGSSYEFRSAIDPQNGRIRDWSSVLGVPYAGYSDAIEKATDFYRQQKLQGRCIDKPLRQMDDIIRHRETAGRRYGGLDYAHQRVLNSWRSARNTLCQVRVLKSGVAAPLVVIEVLLSIFTLGLLQVAQTVPQDNCHYSCA